MPIRIRLEKFDSRINIDKWMTGFKPQRGEIFVERRPAPKQAPEQKLFRLNETDTGAMNTKGRRD
jgi:hypothetical protein